MNRLAIRRAGNRPRVQYWVHRGKGSYRPYKRKQVTDYTGDILVMLLLCMIVGLVVLDYST